MELLDLSDDVMDLVGERVANAREQRLIVSLPFDSLALRRLPCASYDDKMYVLYAPHKLSPELHEHINNIAHILKRHPLDPPPVTMHDGLDLSRWTYAYIGYETNLYALKASLGLKGSVRMEGYRPLIVYNMTHGRLARDRRSEWRLLRRMGAYSNNEGDDGVQTEGRTAVAGSEFRLNNKRFRRELGSGGRLVWREVHGNSRGST
jgi:hypothetical protein